MRRLLLLVLFVMVAVASPGYFEREEPPVPSPTPVPGFAAVRTRLTLITDVPQPVAMAVRRNDRNLYVATKEGRVLAVRNRRTRLIMDIRKFVKSEGEAGLLGLAFTPDGKRLFIDYVNTAGHTRIRSWPFDGNIHTNGTEMMRIDHPDLNFHHGGNLVFGPDGYLYISHGDGGIPRDPKNRAQSLNALLGKILRVGVNKIGKYWIPNDNPFVGREGVQPEIWAMGLRNPWRFSFDALRGDMWIGDVGLTKREEINLEAADSKGGKNFGWSFFEGTNPIKGNPPPGLVAPVHQYDRAKGNCAVIGGYVYRGQKIPGLRGAYLFGDLCGGRIRAIRLKGGRVGERRTLPGKVDQFTSFGQDAAGELYVMSLNDGLYRIDPA